MSQRYKLCESCVIRHCNRNPKEVKSDVQYSIPSYFCTKYRKHSTGWKVKDVMHNKQRQ